MDTIINANDLIRTDHLQKQAEADHHPFQMKGDTLLLVQSPIKIKCITQNFSRQIKSNDFDLNEYTWLYTI